MTIADWVLVAALIVFAWAGWRRGFVAGVLSFAGFLGGGLLAAFVLPDIVEQYLDPGMVSALVMIAAVLVLALLGQALATILGGHLRRGISWTPMRVADSALGAGLNVLVLALLTWVVVSAIAFLPRSSVTDGVRDSRVLVALDGLVPDEARDAFIGMRDVIAGTAMPRVFAGLGEVIGPDVPAPDPDAAGQASVRQVRDAVVRVTGSASECMTTVSGSGFVYDPQYVLTNAHVVAGIDTPRVQVRDGAPVLDATVVAFDPRLDAAVLHVPGLDSGPLAVAAAEPESGDDAVVAGFPGGGRFRADAVRIRATVTARGEDIYGHAGVEREVYSFRGLVEPGNSGGPLLTTDGRVLGMVFGAGVSDAATGFAITAPQLAGIMQTGVGERQPAATGSCRIRD